MVKEKAMEKEFRHCLFCGEIVVRDDPGHPWRVVHEEVYPNEYTDALASGDVDPDGLLYCHCGCQNY